MNVRPPAPPAAGDSRPSWPHVGNAIIALWLITSPPTLGYQSAALTLSDYASGVALLIFSSLAGRREWAAWAACGIGLWVMSAPLIFWAPTAAAYHNGTLSGALIVGFSAILPRLALHEPSTRPPGWSYNPSSWSQRLPIVFLALLGFFFSRYMAAYQLGHIATVWDPFFGDGTQRVLTSDISRAFPVSDAGLGALSYLCDAVAGLLGGRRRWRTMPWMVLLFGFFIIPPGVTSIVLVILQPLGVGAWCTLCLVTAVVMLMMVPPALDEVIATAQFLQRTRRQGRSLWRALWFGEGDAAEEPPVPEARRSSAREITHAVEIFSMPWNLWLTLLAGAWLMAAPGVLGITDAAARHDIVTGALVVTIAVVAAAEPTRAARFLNIVPGVWVAAVPWLLPGCEGPARWSNLAAGLALIAFSLPRGRITDRYGTWDRWIV